MQLQDIAAISFLWMSSSVVKTMNSAGEREEVELSGSALKGEKWKVLLNAVNLQISSPARDGVGARKKKTTYQQGKHVSMSYHKYLSRVDS